MSLAFNVAFEPWIPCTDLQGKPARVSLCAVFTEGSNYADLAVRPHERVSLMRLFVCVAHAALNGPKDFSEWQKVPGELPEKAKKYLEQWKDSFELFHAEKPWLQVAGLTGVKVSPVTLLDSELASGNNSTLFDHLGESDSREIQPHRLTLNLLTYQNFSSGGGLPVAQWAGQATRQVGNPDAPCLSQSMTHSLFRGRTVLESIHLNLSTQEKIEQVYKSFVAPKKRETAYGYASVDIGKPVWEDFPSAPTAEDAVFNATKTYLGRLVPISRWVKLIQERNGECRTMYACAGFKYDTHKDGFPAEPTASVKVVSIKKKNAVEQERQVVKADPTKGLWRELSSLLIQRSAEGLGGPMAMENAPPDMPFDFMVCAMTRDQASMDLAMESVFHVNPALLEHNRIYEAEIVGGQGAVGAEGYGRRLRRAIEVYRKEVDRNWEHRATGKDANTLRNNLAGLGILYYWTNVEKRLHLLMAHIEAIGTDAAGPTRNLWRKAIFQIACDAYRVACGQETPRQVKAHAKGFRELVNYDEQTVAAADDAAELEEESA